MIKLKLKLNQQHYEDIEDCLAQVHFQRTDDKSLMSPSLLSFQHPGEL